MKNPGVETGSARLGDVLSDLRGRFVIVRCAVCGREFEAYRAPVALDEDAAQAVCSQACEARRFAEAAERRRFAPFDAMVGRNFAQPFDAAKFPGRPAAIAEVLAWRPALDRPNLVLNGVSDRGKSRLAVMALRESFARTGALPLILWPGELALYTAEAWGEVQAKALRDKWVAAPVALFDDPAKDKFTERTAEMFFSVLDARLRHGRPTVVTVNEDESVFAAKFPNPEAGRAALRRLIKHGLTVSP